MSFGFFSHIPWFLWPGIICGCVVFAGSIAFRGKWRMAVRLLRALALDKRLPRPLRCLMMFGLAVESLPPWVPDFNVDEMSLTISGVLLATVYRGRMKAIMADIRAEEAGRQNGE
jgi:hypothetical protein